MTYFDLDIEDCPVELSLQIITRKWVLQLIRDMFFGKTRFKEFKEEKPNLSNKALSRCLKDMESNNLIKRIVNPQDKTDIQYFLTEKGRLLNKVIYELVIFTLENEDNKDKYAEDTKIKIKQLFKEKLEIS